MPDQYLKSLVCPLPEDIARLKGAGLVREALDLIGERLKQPLPDLLRERLKAELILLPQLQDAYTLTEDALTKEIKSRVPDFDPQELKALEERGLLDYIYADGIRLYHEDTAGSLIKSQPGLHRRAGITDTGEALEGVIRRLMEHDLACRFRLRSETRIRDLPQLTPCRVHLPLAARSMQQEPASDIACSLPLSRVAPEDAPQRTAYLEADLQTGSEISLEYTYVQHPRYIDPMDKNRQGPVYFHTRPVCDADLAEMPPHIVFTPLIRSLARQLRKDTTDPVIAARRFYDYITTHVTYAYMPPYRLLENASEYCAANLRGDCGIQALLFIALCRASGIPARWQSGLYAAPGDTGSHDWAEFFSPRLGWLPVDCSFGGGGVRAGSALRQAFYFGNLDPWRMVANREYYAPFTPAKRYPRIDPYDNQRGEIETEGRGLKGGSFRTRFTVLDYQESEE